MSNSVSNKDLYKAIEGLEKKILHYIEKNEDECLKRHDSLLEMVKQNTDWRNQATGKLTVLFVFIGLVVNWFWDLLYKKINI